MYTSNANVTIQSYQEYRCESDCTLLTNGSLIITSAVPSNIENMFQVLGVYRGNMFQVLDVYRGNMFQVLDVYR